MIPLQRQGHFLGAKLRSLRRANGLTLEELSERCVQQNAQRAPSISYLSMIEAGKRVPSRELLELLAGVFGKQPEWFLDENTEVPTPFAKRGRAGLEVMALEPAFLFTRELLQHALPELLSQTGTTGRQFAQLLIRIWQETHHNDFPEIEHAAEDIGHRQMPLSLDNMMEICRKLHMDIRWFDGKPQEVGGPLLRSRFEPPRTLWLSHWLKEQPERLKYDLARLIGHRVLHNGDGLLSAHQATQTSPRNQAGTETSGMATRDVLYAWRDFECSFFAGALLCPRAPFRRFLIREKHAIASTARLGVTPAVVMRRMTAVSPYRHWHFFDAYSPGCLQTVYRANGISLPWGNMTLASDPCPHWAVFRLLRDYATNQPASQISIMRDGRRLRLFCCHSLHTFDAAGTAHVLSVGLDLVPALEAQGIDADEVREVIDTACRRGGGEAAVPEAAREAVSTIAHVLNIGWVAAALNQPATVICPRRAACPREPRCPD